uniref:Uncharacterized protein n=1 Tax=Crocodylus porosus TaxID=8502 RepID=A0A7M4F5L3_CROPO
MCISIYKDVNSKAYLLRLSSFFNLYLHSCSSNLFFSIQFLTVVLFLVHEFFYHFHRISLYRFLSAPIT